jgi:hypothetical protein
MHWGQRLPTARRMLWSGCIDLVQQDPKEVLQMTTHLLQRVE